MEPELKERAENVFCELGLPPTQAMTIFYREVVRRQAPPLPYGSSEKRRWMNPPGPDSRHSLKREREAKERAAFLAESSRLLADSLDYESTFTTVAGLALPHLGAWCFVDVCGARGEMRRLAVIHPDANMQGLARRLEQGWPPERDDPLGLPRAVRTRQSEIVAEVTDEMLEQAAHGEENLQILRQIGIGSLIVVALIARDAVLGAITYVASRAHHPYTEEDLALAEDLASRCAIAIDNARLYQEAREAQAEAEEANRTKTLFLSTMSHELRTPLNAIGGYAELLEMGVHGPLTAEQTQDVRRIQANQRHLLGLVNSLLDYAKIESGRMEYEIEDVPLADVIEQVEPLVLPLAQQRGVEHPKECAHNGLVVRADPERLQHILINLVINAIKFTPRGGQVRVECLAQNEAVTVRVTDTGIGIAPEHLNAVFQPFVQVHNGRTRKEEGTGLGLAISRNLARGMGGDLTVESRLGEGSTFTLVLPKGSAG